MDGQIKDPVNYLLDGTEPDDPKGYKDFLDKLTDVPESAPLNAVTIDEAGITNQETFIQIDDLSDPSKKMPVLCDVTLSVNLTDHRGIHMSRCEEALFELAQASYKDVDEFAIALAEKLREKQSSDVGMVRITAKALQTRSTRKSGRDTHDKIILLSEAVATRESQRQRTGVKAYNMTACPCTRTYTKFSVVPRLRELGFEVAQIKDILDTVLTGTHTQRGTITVVMDKKHADITAASMLGVLDTTTHLVNELLKRPDEHDLVVRALKKPQFTEDVVRDVAVGLFKRFGQIAPEDTGMNIESILYDSIHIHDVRTALTTSLGKLGSILRR